MTFSAVLLAGGESRRMGRDKATLAYDGESLWQRQLEVLRLLQPETIFVAARSDPAWRPSDTVFVADKPPSRGPMSGIAATLALSRSSHLVALAIDMPGMTAAHLATVLAIAIPVRAFCRCGMDGPSRWPRFIRERRARRLRPRSRVAIFRYSAAHKPWSMLASCRFINPEERGVFVRQFEQSKRSPALIVGHRYWRAPA